MRIRDETTSSTIAATYTASGRIANSSPPSAGPPIVETCPPIERSAIAPVKRSAGTISGVSDRPAGFPSAASVPVRAARPTKGQSWSAPCSVTSSSSPITAASQNPHTITTATRGSRSASWPAGSASSGTGTNSASPIRPRSNALWWIV